MAIKVTYRRTSRIRMRIGVNGDLLISAPVGTSSAEIERFVMDNKEWVETTRRKVVSQRERSDDFFAQLPLSTPQEAREVTRRMNELITPLIKKYSALMGVAPSVVKFRATRSKLGHCRKSTGEIMFSVYLLLFPEWIAEHVVVHELAHLIEANHSGRFYALMDRYFPRWKDARITTRQIMRDHEVCLDDDE